MQKFNNIFFYFSKHMPFTIEPRFPSKHRKSPKHLEQMEQDSKQMMELTKSLSAVSAQFVADQKSYATTPSADIDQDQPAQPATESSPIQHQEKKPHKRKNEDSSELKPAKARIIDNYKDTLLRKGRSHRTVEHLTRSLEKCIHASAEDTANLMLILARNDDEAELKAREGSLNTIAQDISIMRQELNQYGGLLSGQHQLMQEMSLKINGRQTQDTVTNDDKKTSTYIKAFINILHCTGHKEEAKVLNDQLTVIKSKNPTFVEIYNYVMTLIATKPK